MKKPLQTGGKKKLGGGGGKLRSGIIERDLSTEFNRDQEPFLQSPAAKTFRHCCQTTQC